MESRRLRWAEHVVKMKDGTGVFRILTGKPTGKRPLGRCKSRWEENIRMDLKEIGVYMRNWIDLAKDGDYRRAFVNAALPWSKLA